MYPVVDKFLSFPTPVIVIAAIALWSCVAVIVDIWVVPILCGSNGKKLVKFEAEVTSQIALAFGLLISFNAVWIWDRGDRVHAAVNDEAAALTALLDDCDGLSDPARGKEIRETVAVYTRNLIQTEWPKLSGKPFAVVRPVEITKLRELAKNSGDPNMLEVVKSAEKFRQVRIRDGMTYMSPSRWGVVFALAVLLLISIGALHGEAPRGRKLALALVTLAISFCFAVLMVHARPFVGQMAIQPIELQTVLSRAESIPAAQ